MSEQEFSKLKDAKEEAKRILKPKLEGYLQSMGYNTSKNFLCINPNHNEQNPSMGYDRENMRVHCFGCGEKYDIIDVIGIEYGLSDYPAKLDRACEIFGIDYKNEIYTSPIAAQSHAVDPIKTQDAEMETDYTDFFLSANKNLGQTEYHRGISRETLDRFKVGFVAEWRHPKAPPMVDDSPRLIIPTSSTSYTARDTRKYLTDAQKQYAKSKVGKVHPINIDALTTATRPIYIVEGELDALSIIDAGGEAIGIGSTSMCGKFLELVDSVKPAQPLILALDKDDAGQTAEKDLAEQLTKRSISFYRLNPCGRYKDANDALIAVRTQLINSIIKQTTEVMEAERLKSSRPDAVSDYLEKTFHKDLKNFLSYKNRKTGFANLDYKIGGLYPGLYVIGAISSLGKTTFMHQLGDQLAAAGDHVLFFSLEQSRMEMVTKSLSRITAKTDKNRAVTSIDIRAGNVTKAVIAAAELYHPIAERVSVIECNFDTDINFIVDYTKKYIKDNEGVLPIVIIDYLQIIPSLDKQGIRETVDANVRGLKKLQSENDLVLFVVSAFNRQNYLTPVDFESFRESSGIEYTADVVWGLQLNIFNDVAFDKEKNIREKREKVREAKLATPRKIELVCLKNRYGRSSYSCYFNYDPRYDLFEVPSGHSLEDSDPLLGDE